MTDSMDKLLAKLIRRNVVTLVIGRCISVYQPVRSVDKEVVESLERLALVDFSTEAGISRLEKSIQFADQLMEVNTESVEPLINTVYERNTNIRNDVVSQSSTREELMKIAPVTEEFYYVAPLGTFSRNKEGESS